MTTPELSRAARAVVRRLTDHTDDSKETLGELAAALRDAVDKAEAPPSWQVAYTARCLCRQLLDSAAHMPGMTRPMAQMLRDALNATTPHDQSAVSASFAVLLRQITVGRTLTSTDVGTMNAAADFLEGLRL